MIIASNTCGMVSGVFSSANSASTASWCNSFNLAWVLRHSSGVGWWNVGKGDSEVYCDQAECFLLDSRSSCLTSLLMLAACFSSHDSVLTSASTLVREREVEARLLGVGIGGDDGVLRLIAPMIPDDSTRKLGRMDPYIR